MVFFIATLPTFLLGHSGPSDLKATRAFCLASTSGEVQLLEVTAVAQLLRVIIRIGSANRGGQSAALVEQN